MAWGYDVALLAFQCCPHFWAWALMPPPTFVATIPFSQRYSTRLDARSYILEWLLIQSGLVFFHVDSEIYNPHPAIPARNVGRIKPRLYHV